MLDQEDSAVILVADAPDDTCKLGGLCVVQTGGGLVLDYEHMSVRAISIFLRTP